jgi:hypothetical protein
MPVSTESVPRFPSGSKGERRDTLKQNKYLLSNPYLVLPSHYKPTVKSAMSSEMNHSTANEAITGEGLSILLVATSTDEAQR